MCRPKHPSEPQFLCCWHTNRCTRTCMCTLMNLHVCARPPWLCPREHLSQQMQEHLPQGHPTGMMPTSGGYHRHTQLCISTVSTRNVLIMTEYGPVKRRKVPWLSNEQNQLHGHSPLTVNVSGSSPCCWNCVPNIPAPLISTISLRGSVIGKSTG